jgi:MoaA/NifB/PqqE/SkfB family radical SAM enzyme
MNPPITRFHFGWQLTGKCNLHCPHCLRQRHDKPPQELSKAEHRLILADYINFLRERKMTGSIQFSGGNPMLLPNIWELLKMAGEAKKEGVIDNYHILGNPETLNERNVGLLKKYACDMFFVSLDGAEERTNDTQRGAGNYRAALWAIQAISETGVKVNIKYTITNRNYLETVEAAELCRKLGACKFVIGSLNQHDDLLELENLKLTEQQETRVSERIDVYNSTLEDKSYEIRWRGTFDRQKQTPPHPPARRNGIGCVVWEDGGVHRRNMHPSPVIGTVPKESFRQIYEKLMKLKDEETKTLSQPESRL